MTAHPDSLSIPLVPDWAVERLPDELAFALRMMRASPAPMLVVCGDSRMVGANPALLALAGVLAPDAEAPWMPLASLLPADAEVWSGVARLIDGTLDQIRVEVALRERIALALSPIRDRHDAVIGVLGVALALPSEAAQEALELGRLVELSPVGVVRYDMDGTILSSNNAFLAMLGLDQEDRRKGLSWRDLTPSEWREADDIGLARLRTQGVMPVFEKEFLHRDGTRVPVLVGAGSLIADRQQGFAVVIDISATRAAERALAGSEARFRAITNAMPQMVWSTRADGFHDYYNDQWYRFTGVPSGSTDGVGWNDMFHPDDQAGAWDKWRHSLSSGDPYEIEYRLRHRDGGYRWVLGRALPVRDEQGAILRWMGTCTDIHEQKLTQHALRDADQRKDEFLAMLGHELRNPLAPIRSAASLLALAKTDPGRVEYISGVIARQSAHMAGLLDDLLDVSRVTRGLIVLEREDVAVGLLIQEAVEQVRPLIDARAHGLSVLDHTDHAQINGDRKRLVQVLSNILSNAAKYTPAGGRIEISARLTGDALEIAVRDSGIGMAPELLVSAFEMFRQGQRTPDRSQGGLGIGLALVKSLVQLHGGMVNARSDGESMGTELIVRLPLHAGPVTRDMTCP